MKDLTTDVLVIGAGPAGLTAAYLLSKSGIKTIVIESDPDLVGGISRTEIKNNFRFDIGGHRFFSKSKIINDLWDEILEEDFLLRDRKSRILYNGKFFEYPLSPFNALFNLGIIESMICVLSYLKAKIFPIKKPRSFHEWIYNNFGERLYEIFFKTYTEKVWGISCDEISSDWAAQRIKGLNFLQVILNSFQNFLAIKKSDEKIKTLIKKFKYPRLGPGMLWNDAKNKIIQNNGQVIMNCTALKYTKDHVRENWQIDCKINQNFMKINAKKIISSVPIKNLMNNLVPEPKTKKNANNLTYRDFITVGVMLKKPPEFYDNWIYIHDPNIKAGRIQNYTSWSESMAPLGKGCLGLEYFCNDTDDFWSKSDDELRKIANDDLKKLGIKDLIPNIIDYHIIRQKKAYPVYDDFYKKNVKKISEEIERDYSNLFLVGRNGMHKYNNQDHSMMSSILTVKNILENNKNFDVWKINVDASYHEDEKQDDVMKALGNLISPPKKI